TGLRDGLAALKPALARVLEQLREAMKLAEREDRTAVLGPLGAVSERIDAIVAEIDRLMRERRAALERHLAEAESTRFWLVQIRRTGVAILIVLVVIAVVLVRRTAGERESALRALAIANADLEAKIAERTAEIRRTMDVLDKTINTMAAAI